MTTSRFQQGLQLHSKVTSGGELELSLAMVPTPQPGENDVVIQVEAAPINPSDLGLLLGAADLSAATSSAGEHGPIVRAPVPAGAMRGMKARLDQAMEVGNEGAGTVVAAGSGAAAQALIGKRVTLAGGAMYSQFRVVDARQVMVLPDGATAEQGASAFVNPLTALGMVETMRMEGHTALVHTAAASNLGQMLNRLCLSEGVGLVNVVRTPSQAQMLRDQGAQHVVDSSAASFMDDLVAAITATGATLAFDAIGGGHLVGQILTAMEAGAVARMTEYSRYGSNTFKQAYIYGALDTRPTELSRAFGFSWAIGAWLLTPFLQKIGAESAMRLRARVAAELTTTFASKYQRTLSLTEALDLSNIAAYARRATGEKYLIDPSR
ncbi:zinc-binding dehydrogenase [Caulobacter sp. NIBR2454]|uniref:zinc-binding dehydrogenase n=1 Tax=Caulobacter sp. NIBR2454 TaxID=3015996 RepID=UPI0022B6BA6D|nr:zinc-binding dehydrogenase [Caulobacter sp. NIBR2454]